MTMPGKSRRSNGLILMQFWRWASRRIWGVTVLTVTDWPFPEDGDAP
jgi:hypothetical protein